MYMCMYSSVTIITPCQQEPTADHLHEAIQALVAEQQEIAHKAAKTTPSLKRLHNRLIVVERYILALSRKGAVPREPSEAGDGGEGGEEEKEEAGDQEKEERTETLDVEVKKEPVTEKRPSTV